MMATLSAVEVGHIFHDRCEQPVLATAFPKAPSHVPQNSIASSSEQSSEQLERTISRATSATERDSGYASAATSLSQSISFNFPSSSTDGIALPERRLMPRKLTHLKVFDKEISQTSQNRFKDLSELFNKRLYEFLNRATKTGIGDISIKLKVLGESETTAQPWVVIQCRKDLEKRVKKFFNQREVLSEYQPAATDVSFPSFKILVRTHPPARKAAAGCINIYARNSEDDSRALTMCGMTIRAYQTDSDCVTTFGGLIKVNATDTEFVLYGLTAGHAVYKDVSRQDLCDCNDEHNGESEFGDISDLDMDSDVQDEEEFELDLPFDEDQKVDVGNNAVEEVKTAGSGKQNFDDTASWLKVGHVSSTSLDKQNESCLDWNEPNLDWALIGIEDPSLCKPNLLLIQYHESVDGMRKDLELPLGGVYEYWNLQARQNVMLLSGVSGIKEGWVSTLPSFLLMSPGSDFIKSYDLKLSDGAELQVGDSGSWVVNKDTLEVVGHVVASDAFKETHVIPMSATFKDIKARLGVSSVSLPSVEDVQDWLNREFRNKRILESSTVPNQQAHAPQKQAHKQQTEPVAPQRLHDITIEQASQLSNLPRNLEDMIPHPSVETHGDDKSASITLEELAHLVQMAKYQDRRLSSSRTHMTRCLISAALSERLTRNGDATYWTLVDNFRAANTKEFSMIYNTNIDLSESLYATWQQPVSDFPLATTKKGYNATPFLEELSQRSRQSILRFIARLRTDPKYLADLICGLNNTEIDGLMRRHGVPETENVLPFRSSASIPSLGRSFTTNTRTPTASYEHSLSLERDDPLAILIHICFHSAKDDLRRTDIWASVCARMISEKQPNSERYINALLMIWGNLREWRGRKNMESYILKILQDGAFLVEGLDTARAGAHSSLTSKEAIRAKEFYESAVEDLFCVIDNSEAGSVPDGLIELGNAIIGKLDSKLHVATRKFLVAKCLFSRFCLTAVTNPEYYGLLLDCHVSENARRKILGEVAKMAERFVVETSWTKSLAVSSPPTIPSTAQTHIKSLMNVFGAPSSKPKYLSKRRTSPATNIEGVPGYFVISPADIVTLVNSLFPQRHSLPSSMAASKSDGASVYSAISTVGSSRAPSVFDNASIFSHSDVSSFSAVTSVFESREPLLDAESDSTDYISTEGDAYGLRLAIAELRQVLGPDAISGNCHPWEERWDVIFISPDGQDLTTRMPGIYGESDDDTEVNNSSSSDDEADLGDKGRSYPFLRDTVLTLLEDYEIPSAGIPESASEYKSVGPSVGVSPNPYIRSRTHSTTQKHPKQGAGQRREDATRMRNTGSPSVLQSMLETAHRQCLAESDFTRAHLYRAALNMLIEINSETLKKDGHGALLQIFSLGPRESIRTSTRAIEECEPWVRTALQSQERNIAALDAILLRQNLLRNKMWYCTDVRNSAAYEDAWNHTRSLTVPSKEKLLVGKQAPLRKGKSRSFLYQVPPTLDLFATYPEHCGSHKLSDEQSNLTLQWLSKGGVENFCKGEERIHRFCLVIDSCATKLVGNSILDGPVLWSSILFEQDRRKLNGVTPDAFDNLDYFKQLEKPDGGPSSANLAYHRLRKESVIDSPMAFSQPYPRPIVEFNQQRRQPLGKYTHKAKDDSPAQRSLRNMSVRSIDSMPPQTIGKSLTEENRAAKEDFLSDLKANLMSLLLSDLAPLLFANGSETDEWFSGDLGHDILEKVELADRRRRESKAKQSTRKSKSSQDVGLTGMVDMEPGITKKPAQEHNSKYPFVKVAHINRDSASLLAQADTTSVGDIDRSHEAIVKSSAKRDFPWKPAFQQLLTTFSTNPSPYFKLEALCDLERQITAYLTATNPHKTKQRKQANESVKTLDPSTDATVEILQDLLKDAEIRPKTLFRDLQFISALVPAVILDKTDRGKSFWNMGLAALGLKQDMCRAMMEIADDIMRSETTAREDLLSTTRLEALKDNRYTLNDAAKMWMIAANEGESTAQRELAIVYLTHPEAVEKAIAPLSKPGEVFKAQVMEMYGSSSTDKEERDRERSDPATMCVAYHWMELSALGGDELAKTYLRQREELAGIP